METGVLLIKNVKLWTTIDRAGDCLVNDDMVHDDIVKRKVHKTDDSLP